MLEPSCPRHFPLDSSGPRASLSPYSSFLPCRLLVPPTSGPLAVASGSSAGLRRFHRRDSPWRMHWLGRCSPLQEQLLPRHLQAHRQYYSRAPTDPTAAFDMISTASRVIRVYRRTPVSSMIRFANSTYPSIVTSCHSCCGGLRIPHCALV